MTMHGNRKPNKNRIFFIDFPSFLSIVQENVASSKPNVPYKSKNGIAIMTIENPHTNNNCKHMLNG